MRLAKGLIICRILVVVLLLNIVTPLALANEAEEGYALLCTSAGMVKVSLSEDAKLTTAANSSDRCPYCQFADTPIDFSVAGWSYPKPDTILEFAYKEPLLKPFTHHLLNHAHLRAPPPSI